MLLIASLFLLTLALPFAIFNFKVFWRGGAPPEKSTARNRVGECHSPTLLELPPEKSATRRDVPRSRRGKIALVANLISFACVFVFATIWIFGGRVYGVETGESVSELALAAAFIGAGLVTGLGAIGTGIAVSSAAAAAIGAISENENNFGKAMIFVAMAEGIAIYGLLISFMILGRV
ncbi:MAG: ATP synthase subunit C [Defluviitaleaceae bacterium]|nr:ATP synthase subunit C [Defluviitaleaceae bacterium]